MLKFQKYLSERIKLQTSPHSSETLGNEIGRAKFGVQWVVEKTTLVGFSSHFGKPMQNQDAITVYAYRLAIVRTNSF